MAGDGAVQAADGYYRILGRIDDVINVAGHRLGTKEIESAALLVADVVEAAVVPVADEIKGKVPDLYVALKLGLAPSTEIANKISASVVSEIGAIARPRRVIIVPDMPKTVRGRSCAACSQRSRIGRIRATYRRLPIRRSSTRSRSWVASRRRASRMRVRQATQGGVIAEDPLLAATARAP